MRQNATDELAVKPQSGGLPLSMAIEPHNLRPLRLLAVLEATTLNAVAKNILDFCQGITNLNMESPASARIEVSIVTFDRTPDSGVNQGLPNHFVTTARKYGITIDVLQERFRFDMGVVPALKAVVARRAPDVIATHNVKSHFLTRVCRLHRDRPWVAFHHGYTTTDLKMRAYNQLDRWSLASADRVVTVCGPFARQLQDRGIAADRISVQHNSIGSVQPACVNDIHAVKERFGLKAGHRLILTIGRLSREKGHVDLVAAFADLRDKHPGTRAKLLIVGEGPERSAIELAIRSHGLEEHVYLAGHTDDVRPYYAAADVFVLPSHSEGSPYVLLEAMNAGVPIAATAVGGVPEILTNEMTALLVQPHNPTTLGTAIDRILNDVELSKRIAANASLLVSGRFSLDSYVRSVSRLYHSLALKNIERRLQPV